MWIFLSFGFLEDAVLVDVLVPPGRGEIHRRQQVDSSGANWRRIYARIRALSQKTTDRDLTRSPMYSKVYLISNASTAHDF